MMVEYYAVHDVCLMAKILKCPQRVTSTRSRSTPLAAPARMSCVDGGGDVVGRVAHASLALAAIGLTEVVDEIVHAGVIGATAGQKR